MGQSYLLTIMVLTGFVTTGKIIVSELRQFFTLNKYNKPLLTLGLEFRAYYSAWH